MSSEISAKIEAIAIALREVPGLHVETNAMQAEDGQPPVSPIVYLSEYSIEVESGGYSSVVKCDVSAAWTLRGKADSGISRESEMELLEDCLIELSSTDCAVRVTAIQTDNREQGSNYVQSIINTEFIVFLESST